MRSAAALLAAALLAACDIAAAPPPNATPAPPAIGQAPTPAPPPAELLEQAVAAQEAGDGAAAGEALSALLQTHPASPEAAPARLLLAELFAGRGSWTSAAELLRPLADGPADSPERAPALFWLARAHAAAGDHAAAIGAYERYRALGTPLAPYAALGQAEQHAALAQPAEAAAAYVAAADSPIARTQRASASEQAIAQLLAAGRPVDALDRYAALIDLARDPAYRARQLAAAAALAQQTGDAGRARTWLVELATALPETAPAAAAADQLRAAGDPALAPALAGQIYLAAERWSDAVTSLDAAIAQEADPERAVELRRRRALALRGAGDFPGALAALAEAGALSPNGRAGRQAQLDWVQSVGQSGDPARAVQGYREFAAAYPDDPLAPEALDRAALLLDRLGDAVGAQEQRLALGQAYPASAQGQSALRRAGLALFEAGRHADALAAFAALAEANAGAERARGAFWAARSARALGDEARAAELFAAAAAAAPESYYGVRAAEELGPLPAGSAAIGAPLGEADWETLSAWAAGWSPAEVSQPAAEADPAVHAGLARLLAEVGLGAAARAEWEAGLEAAGDEPAALLALAKAAHAAGNTRTALLAADRLRRLAPAEAAAPEPLARLRFPTPFPELVRRETTEFGVDPLLFYALLRQESLFDPAATSWVGARGLAQIMPETGQGIAQNLGVAPFALNDLYRPAVSLRFGAFYLGQRLKDMEGSPHGALAAYNGGLGNSLRWAGGSQVADPDLFAERIDYPETQGYVKAVYGFYGVYRRLYAR